MFWVFNLKTGKLCYSARLQESSLGDAVTPLGIRGARRGAGRTGGDSADSNSVCLTGHEMAASDN